MRAVRSAPPGVEVVDVDEPEGPGALVRIRSASICASDLGYIAAGSRFVLGHELARPGGSVGILGLHHNNAWPFHTVFLKEVRLVPSIGYGSHERGRDFDDAAAMLATDPGIGAALITHRFPLEDAPEAFRVAADKTTGALRVVLEP